MKKSKNANKKRKNENFEKQTKVKTEDTLSGFQDFFLQPIIKDRPNKKVRFFLKSQ